MNQEQNNLNQNNLNTQGYNGTPNNQSLNYQNKNMEETILNVQQSPIYQNLDTNKPKKNYFKLVIGIIAIIAISLIAVGLFLLPKSKENMINSTKSNLKRNIKHLSINSSILSSDRTITALTDSGDLYYGEGELDQKVNTKDIKKIASNIEKFHNDEATYFIDQNHDLFYIGCSYNSGCSDEAKKDYSNVKDINTYMNFCGLLINDNNELLIKNNHYSKDYCGLNKSYNNFTKIADNVRQTIVYDLFSGYINYDNELYISTANAEFKKVLDDVKTVSAYGFDVIFILTNDSKLYLYDLYKKNESENYTLKLLKDDVKELGSNYFQTNNGDYNVISVYENFDLIKGESKVLFDQIYYGVLDIEDIKEIIYFINNEDYSMYNKGNLKQKKIVYISKDGNLVLQDENTKKKIAYNTDNLAEILNFVLEKTPITEK